MEGGVWSGEKEGGGDGENNKMIGENSGCWKKIGFL